MKDTVSKTNKGYFFTFYLKKSHAQKPIIFRGSQHLSLLKTVFYKKHPIDGVKNWSYHYSNNMPQSSLIFELGNF
jgi:hypothetical protein